MKLIALLGGAAALLGTLSPSRATDLVYMIAETGWRFERFGTDVAVLRADITAERQAGAVGSIVITCEGRERRFRLSLSAARSPRPFEGSFAIRTRTASGAPNVVGLGRAVSGVATIPETGDDRRTLLGAILATNPTEPVRIEVLTRTRSRAFRDLDITLLTVPSDRIGDIAFSTMRTACFPRDS